MSSIFADQVPWALHRDPPESRIRKDGPSAAFDSNRAAGYRANDCTGEDRNGTSHGRGESAAWLWRQGDDRRHQTWWRAPIEAGELVAWLFRTSHFASPVGRSRSMAGRPHVSDITPEI